MRLCLSFDIDLESGFQFNGAVCWPDYYLLKPTFCKGFIEYSKVSAGRTRKGNKNYLTFIKSSKIFGKIIFYKKIAPG